MATPFNRLAELYGLSPATMASLANVANVSQPPPPAPNQSVAPDPDSPEAWAAREGDLDFRTPEEKAAVPNPGPAVRPLGAGQTYGDIQPDAAKGIPADPKNQGGRYNGGSFKDGVWTPDPPPATDAPAQDASSGGAPQDAAPSTGGGYYVVPGGWQPGSHTVALHRGMSPQELEPGQYHRDVAAGHRQIGLDKTLEAAQQQGLSDAVYTAARTQAEQQFAANQEKLRREKEAFTKSELAKLDKLAVQANAKIDPKAAFKEKGSLGALTAAIFVGLGAYASAWKGGPNQALQIINASIDRNIDAQKTNAANAQQAYNTRANLYRQNLEAFGDQERALIATKIHYLDQVKAMVDQRYASTIAPLKNEAAYAELTAKLNDQRAGEADRFAMLTHTKADEQMTETFRPAHVVGGASKQQAPNVVTLSDGTEVSMPNDTTQNKAIEKIELYDKLQRRNNEILRLRTEAKELMKNPSLQGASRLATVHKQLQDLGEEKSALLSKAAEQGVLKEAEYDRAMKMQVGATSFSPGTDDMLRRQTQRWDEDQKAVVKAAGGRIVKKGYVRTPTGQLTPTAEYVGKDVKVDPQLPPDSFKPMDSRQQRPTQGPSLEATTPRKPVQSAVPGKK